MDSPPSVGAGPRACPLFLREAVSRAGTMKLGHNIVQAAHGGWDISRCESVGALLAVPFFDATEPIKGTACRALL